MKLLCLDLKAVGPFTDVVLDLSAGEQGLHLIYGPNEAGKTSALRALSHLLFGFPHLSGDNFVHPNDRLRVGGKLRFSDGDVLELFRRRGNRNTLRGPDDSSVLGDGHLARFLGGTDRETFEAMFGIDHERLSRGGEEIRTGRGQLGELLFAAGSGLAGLRQAQHALQRGLDDLFKPRAQNPRINKALAELRDTQDELKRLQLPSENWQQHDRAYHEARAESDQLRGQIRAARTEQGRIKRIKSAIAVVARRRRLTQERDDLREVVRLREAFGDEFRAAHDQFRLAESTIEEARAEIAELDAQRAQLDPPRALIDAADELEMLRERLGAVEKASADRMRLENFLSDCEHQARRILRDLGRPPNLDEAEALRLRADEPQLIRGLGQRFAELRGQTEELRRAISRHDDQVQRQEEELAGLENPRDVEPLRRVVSQARKAGDLDRRLGEARAKLAIMEKKAAAALEQLPGWSRSADDLRRQPVPLSTTLDLYEARFQEGARNQQTLARRLAVESDAIRELESRLQSLELQDSVPSEQAVLAARTRRDQGWQLVKAAWLERADEVLKAAAFLAGFAPGETLASAYEKSVELADTLADRLRREADRVARKAEWLAGIEEHRAARTALEQESRALDDQHSFLERDWSALVDPVGCATEARTPAEFHEWLRRREDVLQLWEKAEEAGQSVEPLEQTLTLHRREVSQALVELGEPAATAGSDLGGALDQAEAAIQRRDDLAQKRSKLRTKIAALRGERAAAELSLKAAETALGNWQSDWAAKMALIGLEASAMPEQAEVFLTKISELLEKLNERRNHESRIRGIDRDAEQFARDVAALAARVAVDLNDRPASEAVRELTARLRDAQADAHKCSTMAQQRRRAEGRLRAAEAGRDAARVCLERLCMEAGCTELDQLADAERRSQNRARLESDFAACEEQLIAAAAGADPLTFTAEVEQADPDALEASLEELESRIAGQETELGRVDQSIGAERAELARMDGGDRAAETAEKAQTLLAGLQGDVARYATLKLAAVALHRGIEKYREKHQGPILERASAVFAALTCGSFARLQIDDDGDGQSMLKGVRPDGRLVDVSGMSDGSHDQLYLAVRLASLESWLLSHEPIPFVVDDILLNFDDHRATAALLALAELSRRTQVLFFTHHRHIIHLARAHLPREVAFIHELRVPQVEGA
jgi:uncharacterized protein YhaN